MDNRERIGYLLPVFFSGEICRKKGAGTIMKRIACFCLLAALLLAAGCAAKTDYYSDLKDQRDAGALSSHRDGLALMGTQEHRKAIVEMKKAILEDPNVTDAYLSLSRSHFAIGDYEMCLYYHMKYKEQMYLRDRVQDFPVY
jgi:Tfp pilus assembly protein PilF